MSKRLNGKTAFITGGNSGIGLATAQEFVAQGAKVAILARTEEKATEALEQIYGDAIGIVGDVANLASLKSVFGEIERKLGHLDIVMASAGIAPPGNFADVRPEDFDTVFDVNVKGSFFTVQYALPLLRKGSSVILVSSSLNEMGMEGYSVYNSSKAAIRSLARSLSLDLAKIGARINVLSPGPVRTLVLEKSGMSEEHIEKQYGVFNEVLAAGRAGRPEEMAKTALFLASDDSSYMYGAEIQADGGMNQTRWPK
ncbi:MAG: SDR family oxidoreductase [Pseudomonadota bacterium]